MAFSCSSFLAQYLASSSGISAAHNTNIQIKNYSAYQIVNITNIHWNANTCIEHHGKHLTEQSSNSFVGKVPIIVIVMVIVAVIIVVVVVVVLVVRTVRVTKLVK